MRVSVLHLCLFIFGCGLFHQYRPDTVEDRLIYYSLKQIATEEQLQRLFCLPAEAREGWLRRFWKELDPTPTTPENERKDEHERRVAYALEHYSTHFWGRPWDDRGDAYIKFGEPDHRDLEMELGGVSETWYYYHSDLTLRFAENELEDGYSSVPIPKRVVRTKQDYFVERATAEAEVASAVPAYDYGIDTSLPYYCEWSRFRGGDGNPRVEFFYAVPTEELHFSDEWAEIGGRLSVFDHSYKEMVARVDEQRVAQDMIGKGGLLTGTLDFSVVPGDYMVAFRLEDVEGHRMGILKSRFSASDFSRLSVSDLSLESPIRLMARKKKPVKGECPLRRVFRRSEKIVLGYEVYNLVKSPIGRTWYKTEYLVRAHKRAVGDVGSTFEGRGDASRVKNRLSLDLSASPPGDYDLVVTVRDMVGKTEASASRSLTLVE